ncbi:MAG: bifunctional UDP-N-acetylglucosamine diphosphorylase/glucosamine-1-phosphate N-acetyltransferase GlmU [Nitrospirae bacterium]|nr:bifunctional UDP-N-acetylglucosamine diphosphorylase/glucosamine-1-phosphate N-acetyltransferase GlmU [Nitrospirota bacterium]
MNVCVVILAAGRGKRMMSSKPKVLHLILGKPMIQYTIDAVKELRPRKIIIVVNSGAEEVKKQISNSHVSFVFQKELLGTGNALLGAKKELTDINDNTIIVLNGDSPLITSKTLKELLKNHRHSKNDLSFLSFIDESLSGYGRILRDERGRVSSIVEDKHATLSEKRKAKELNAGVYAMQPELLNYIGSLRVHRSSGEYYLTDLIEMLSKNGKKIEAYRCPTEDVRGVNTREDVSQVTEILNMRNISRLMKNGVTFIDPKRAIVHSSVSIGRDTVVYPDTFIEGRTSIGKECIIYPGVRIYESKLGNRVTIKDNTLIELSNIKEGSTIGPFAHLRPHNNIGRNVKIGNFVELKKSIVGDGTKAQHLSYLGDAIIGEDVNIGAGTITCNYDGIKKHTTVIGSGVFLGSDSQLIAPVEIGKGAYVAAGTTVTKNVPSHALAIGRVKQENIKDWAIKKQLKVQS